MEEGGGGFHRASLNIGEVKTPARMLIGSYAVFIMGEKTTLLVSC